MSKENQFFINKSKLHLSRKEVSSFLSLAADAVSYTKHNNNKSFEIFQSTAMKLNEEESVFP